MGLPLMRVGSLEAPSTATERGANSGVRLANRASGILLTFPRCFRGQCDRPMTRRQALRSRCTRATECQDAKAVSRVVVVRVAGERRRIAACGGGSGGVETQSFPWTGQLFPARLRGAVGEGTGDAERRPGEGGDLQ